MRDAGGLFAQLRALEARRLALHAAALSFLIASGLAFVVALACFLSAARPSPGLLALFFVLPPGAALLAFLLGRRGSPDMGKLALRLDVELRLDAKLCSLHELHARGEAGGYFASRLSQAIEKCEPPWRRAFRATSMTRLLLAAGCACFLAGAILAPLAAVPRAATADAPGVARSVAASDAEAATPDDEAPLALPPALPETEDSRGADRAPAESEDAAAGVALADLLTELRGRTGAEAVLASPSDAAAAMESAARDASAQLRQVVGDLASATGPLSEAELEAVRRAAAGSADLGDMVEGVLGSAHPSRLRNELLALLEQPSARPVSTTVGDVVAAEPEEVQAQSAMSATSPDSAPPGAVTAPGGDGDSSTGTLGGSEESGQPDTSPSPYESTFVAVAPPGAVGDAGPVLEYLTRGVPVEGAAGEPSAGRAPAIDFARVDSILSTRSVPPETLETIRAYFEEITRGGP